VIHQENSADGGIYATRDNNDVRSLRNLKENDVGRGMMTSGVVFLHDYARPHTAARTRALLELFDREFV
jgi:hypothetical protein